MKERTFKRSHIRKGMPGIAAVLGGAALLSPGAAAFGGTVYTSTSDPSWFNGTNWSADPTIAADDDIFNGQGFSNLTPDGVVFDPANDANYIANTSYTFAGGNKTAQQLATVPKIYLAGGSTSSSTTALVTTAAKLSIFSGTLTLSGSDLVIGRPQAGTSTTVGTSAASATLVLKGGNLSLPGSVDMASNQTAATLQTTNQTDLFDYSNTSTFTATSTLAKGLRMNVAGVANGYTNNSTLELRHVAGGTGSFNVASFIMGGNAASTAGTANSTTIFHYGAGNVDTVNVGVTNVAGNKLQIRNASTGGGTINSFLSLVLDSVPTVDPISGFVQNLGLFSVEDSKTGAVANTTPASLSAANEFNGLPEGSTVSAVGPDSNTYSWTLYYDGNINGSTITAPTTGAANNDVVLIGQLASVPEPATLGLVTAAGLLLTGRRRRLA